MNPNRRPRIVVVGSINVDFVVRAERLPRPGETVIGTESRQLSGGKGANQAVAAARLGADVTLIGRVGDDSFGREMLERLCGERVNVDHVQVTADCETGLAAIQVESTGENSIVIVPGANGRVTPADVLSAADAIRAADLLLLQLEVPLDAVLAACSLARAAGVPVLLDPAPAPRTFPSDLFAVDFVCPNESEAATITGRPVGSLAEARAAAQALIERGAGHAIITLGERGVWLNDGKGLDELVASFAIEPLDTTAAGDAFAAAFAVSRAEGSGLRGAVRFGCAAGAITASRFGAQPSLPTRAEVDCFLLGTLRSDSP